MNQRNVHMGNRILYSKSIERNQEIHQQKLKEIKYNMKSRSPLSFEINKKKKEILQEAKHTEIERENRLLLEKITSIMQNKQVTVSLKKVMSPKSLNKSTRKKKLVQIAEENQFLLRRLQEKKSNYDVIQYEQQWINTKNFINAITGPLKTPKQSQYSSNYPSQFDSGIQVNQSFSHSRIHTSNPIQKRSMKANTFQIDNNLYGQQNDRQSINVNQSLTQNFRLGLPKRGQSATYRTNSSHSSNSRYQGNVNQSLNLQKQKVELFKQVKLIDNIHFDLEIYIQDGKLRIVADEIEGEETKMIEIPQEEALAFLKEECNNDINSLVLRLRYANNQLFLIGSKKSREKVQQNLNQRRNSYSFQDNNHRVNYQNINQKQNYIVEKQNSEIYQQNQMIEKQKYHFQQLNINPQLQNTNIVNQDEVKINQYYNNLHQNVQIQDQNYIQKQQFDQNKLNYESQNQIQNKSQQVFENEDQSHNNEKQQYCNEEEQQYAKEEQYESNDQQYDSNNQQNDANEQQYDNNDQQQDINQDQNENSEKQNLQEEEFYKENENQNQKYENIESDLNKSQYQNSASGSIKSNKMSSSPKQIQDNYQLSEKSNQYNTPNYENILEISSRQSSQSKDKKDNNYKLSDNIHENFDNLNESNTQYSFDQEKQQKTEQNQEESQSIEQDQSQKHQRINEQNNNSSKKLIQSNYTPLNQYQFEDNFSDKIQNDTQKLDNDDQPDEEKQKIRQTEQTPINENMLEDDFYEQQQHQNFDKEDNCNQEEGSDKSQQNI